MIRFNKAYVVALVLGVIGVAALTGCGSEAKGEAGANGQDVKTIVVGTGNHYEPYCYLDKDGNLAGYEYEVLKAVDELLPQYKFEYRTSQFADVLVALDAGQIDLAAHQYEKNDQRQAKYLFGKEAYTTYATYPVVLTSNNQFKSLDDLKGKKVFTSSAASNSTYMLEQYNKKHPDNPIQIVTLENATPEAEASGMKKGVWDAIILTERDMDKLNRDFGNGTPFLKHLKDPVQTSSTYWLYRKDETELQTAVDGALKQLKDSGKLAEISKKVLGGDYTK